jgi:hypothetical protein
MIRTSKLAVAKIIELDDTINAGDIDFAMEAANALVDAVCLESSYSDALLELIERWLSAHFYSIRDPRAEKEGADDVDVKYQGETKTGLEHTSYGQQAMTLDHKGNLAAVNNNSKNAKSGKVSLKHIAYRTP